MEKKELKTYYDFAENDYLFYMDAYKNDLLGNQMGAMAQQICEKYLKHIVNEYIHTNSLIEEELKQSMLKTHNLIKLEKYISQLIPDIKLDRSALNAVNGLYFTTRYPGDESFLVERGDIDEYTECVEEVKKCVESFIFKHPDKKLGVQEKKHKSR